MDNITRDWQWWAAALMKAAVAGLAGFQTGGLLPGVIAAMTYLAGKMEKGATDPRHLDTPGTVID
jgi:hypothetical protein